MTEFYRVALTDGLVVTAVILLSVYLYRTILILRKLGVSGPTPLPFIGNLLTYRKGENAAFSEWRKKYGRAYRIFQGLRPKLVVSDPDMVKQIMVKDFSSFPHRTPLQIPSGLNAEPLMFTAPSELKRRRSILTPAFTTRKLKTMMPLVNRCADHLMENLDKLSVEGKTFDAKRVFSHYTMDVTASTVFGVEVNSQKNPQDPFVENANKVDMTIFSGVRFSLIIAGILSTVLPKYILQKMGFAIYPSDAVSFFNGVLKDIMDRRSKQSPEERRTDLLEQMIKSSGGDSKGGAGRNQGLSLDEVTGHTVGLFVAGYDTTSGLLASVAVWLARYTDVMQKMHHEITSIVKETDEIQHEEMQQLEYLEMVLMETLRHSQLGRTDRLCVKDTTLKWIAVPAGTEVLIDSASLSRDPEYWVDPLEFIPERFCKEEQDKRHPFSFLPFGAGPHMCLGMRLALMEAKIALARVLQKYRFVSCTETPEPLGMEQLAGNKWVKVERLDY